MKLALGDSIAMALMARNKFKQVNFKELHPGGMLGQSLLEVKSLMHSKNEIPLVSEKANMRQALLEITSKRFGCVGIVTAVLAPVFAVLAAVIRVLDFFLLLCWHQ